MPQVLNVPRASLEGREGGGLKIELYFPESDQIYRIKYETADESLNVQFHNADWYAYKSVPPELVNDWTKASSAGSFFHARIKPVYVGEKWHTGTLAERAEIWLRSKDAQGFKGSAVALQMGNPVSVCAWMELEKIADLRSLYDGDKSVVIVEVPNAVEARVE